VIGPRKLLFAMIFILAVAGPSAVAATASANDIYFAQNAQGANNGQDCADAYAYNDGTNGINKAANWAPGNTLHICGTISAPAGTNLITCQASGSSSGPITIKWESGAILQEPYFGTGGSAGINLTGCNYITLDGGNTGVASLPTSSQAYNTGGVIQAYANGTSGTSACPGASSTGTAACTYQTNPTTLIQAANSNNLTVENLVIGPAYVVTATDGNNGAPGAAGIYFQGSNVTITNNQFHDDGIGIDNTSYGTASNTVISNNDFQEQGWALGCAGATGVNANYQFYGNHLHNFDRWTLTPAHVNGIHCYDLGQGSAGGISSFYLYNNLFDGNMGSCCWTAWAYFEADGPGQNWVANTGALYAFNNVFVAPSNCCLNGNGLLNYGGGQGHMILNNYFYGTQAQGGPCIDFTGSGPGQTIENNVFENCGQVIAGTTFDGNPAPAWVTWDYNIYANISSGNTAWAVNSINTNSLSTWQSGCGCDAHSNAQMGSLLADITNEGVPSAGYMGIAQGANLTNIASGNLAALDYDTSAGNARTPVQRPGGTCSTQGTTSCWDIGGYQLASGDPPPAAPAGLKAVVQ